MAIYSEIVVVKCKSIYARQMATSFSLSKVASESQSAVNQVLDGGTIAFVERSFANIPVDAQVTQLPRIRVNCNKASLYRCGGNGAALGRLLANHHRIRARSFRTAHDREQAA